MLRSFMVTLAIALTAFTAGDASAQNVLGAERTPANPAEVQRQLEKDRRDLDTMNRRDIQCEQERTSDRRTLPGEPPSPSNGTLPTACAP